ncbi:hypothetical protein CUMW_206950 [Citrus unshiu]|uniref:Uncharacterized protein n=1 Tax=Citrus unshiu TaxID=55188 RepID=A0A2H5Q9Z3_CITUN|nr:hypothetical protein CUMW_206950 [Citrus unshiu]
MSSSSMPTPYLQTSGMLSKEQLLHLFNRFSFLTSQPDVKKRVADAVEDEKENSFSFTISFFVHCIVLFHFADVGMLDCMQEAIAVTTEIQEEIFQEMGIGKFVIDPSFGLACLGKVNLTYENDQDLMIQFYKFVATTSSSVSAFGCILSLKLCDLCELWNCLLSNAEASVFYSNILKFGIRIRNRPLVGPMKDDGLVDSLNGSLSNFSLSIILLTLSCAREEMVCDEAVHGPDEFAERMDSQQKLQEQQLEMLNYMRRFHLDDQSAILEKLHHQMEDANFESAASVLSSEQIQEIVRRRVSPVFRSR